ncbi:hypothetical protein [Acidovorax radicis]|jgi:hypothetical protein|uniref:hypothetical protein n=1 Tax=Acidovorax radicis TaxID=758826 RepID=UPI001CF877B1|nr:hypothetical protein [Acidovorax radicis]UCU99278.1 hypothetical protein KI609_00190 [Acidovorax radicis]
MPRTPNPPAPAPTGPEPSVDTTKRQAPGPKTQGLLREPGAPPNAQEKAQEKPKLPHERDESVDMTHGKPDVQIEQAYRDVQRGLQDTDRGPPADKAYQKQKS